MQSYKDFETVAIYYGNDESEYEKIQQEKIVDNIKFHCGAINSSEAKNIGIDKSCGELIIFLDQDVLLNPMYLNDLLVAVDEKYRDEFIMWSAPFYLEPGWSCNLYKEIADDNVKNFLVTWQNEFNPNGSYKIIEDDSWVSSYKSNLYKSNLCVVKSFILRNDLFFDKEMSGGEEIIDWLFRSNNNGANFILLKSNCWKMFHWFSIEAKRKIFRKSAKYNINKNSGLWRLRKDELESCHAEFKMKSDGMGSKLTTIFDDTVGE